MLRYQIKTVTKARSVTKPKQGPNQSLLRQSVPESDRSPTVTSRDRGTTSSKEVDDRRWCLDVMSATDSYAPKATVVTRISGSQVVGLPDSDFSRSGRIASGRRVKGLQGGSDYGSKSLTRFFKATESILQCRIPTCTNERTH